MYGLKPVPFKLTHNPKRELKLDAKGKARQPKPTGLSD